MSGARIKETQVSEMLEPGVSTWVPSHREYLGGGPTKVPGLFPVSSAARLLLCHRVNIFTGWVCPPDWDMVSEASPRGPGAALPWGSRHLPHRGLQVASSHFPALCLLPGLSGSADHFHQPRAWVEEGSGRTDQVLEVGCRGLVNKLASAAYL